MIGRLHGILLEKQAPFLLVDVQGVGYEVEAPMSTFYNLPEIGEDVVLFTHFVVREDAQQLFGFGKERERQLFRSLIRVNGIGPKVALSILSALEPEIFVSCILAQDENTLVKIPGVGKKTAQRLVVEMQDRLKDFCIENPEKTSNSLLNPTMTDPTLADAQSALISLGYRPHEASRALAAVAKEGLNSQELIRLALKQFVA